LAQPQWYILPKTDCWRQTHVGTFEGAHFIASAPGRRKPWLRHCSRRTKPCLPSRLPPCSIVWSTDPPRHEPCTSGQRSCQVDCMTLCTTPLKSELMVCTTGDGVPWLWACQQRVRWSVRRTVTASATAMPWTAWSSKFKRSPKLQPAVLYFRR